MSIPIRILIIGLFFCLMGVISLWETIVALFSSRLFINLGIFMIPVGLGLLRGQRASLWWARFWIIIGYIFCALVIAAANWPYAVLVGIGSVVFLIISHLLLYSAKSLAYLVD
jgi:hypothetical protein